MGRKEHTNVHCLAVVQDPVDKVKFFDYAAAVNPDDECWLGLVQLKLLAHDYDYPDQMLHDIDKIKKCAEQYHGKRQSKLKDIGQPFCVQVCIACHARHSVIARL